MICDYVKKVMIVEDTNAIVSFGILPSDLKRAIFAAIVDDQVFKVSVRLTEHAFDAIRQIWIAVVNGGHYAHERLMIIHCGFSVLLVSLRGKPQEALTEFIDALSARSAASSPLLKLSSVHMYPQSP